MINNLILMLAYARTLGRADLLVAAGSQMLPVMQADPVNSVHSSNYVSSEISAASQSLLQDDGLAKCVNSGFGRCDLTDVIDGTAGFALNGEGESNHFGLSVSSAGDINGDGLDDLIIGAELADSNGFPDAGTSYVILGSTDVGPKQSSVSGTSAMGLFGNVEARQRHNVAAANNRQLQQLATLAP